MVSWLLAMLILGGCVAASVYQWRTIAASRAPRAELLTTMRGTKTHEELSNFSRSLPAESGERELLEAIVQSSSRSEAVARMNEQLGEVESHLGSGRRISSAASRIAAFSGLLFATVELSRTLTSAEGVAWQSAAAVALLGAAAAIVAKLFGRSAERIARARRAAWDEVVDILVRRLDDRFPR